MYNGWQNLGPWDIKVIASFEQSANMFRTVKCIFCTNFTIWPPIYALINCDANNMSSLCVCPKTLDYESLIRSNNNKDLFYFRV